MARDIQNFRIVNVNNIAESWVGKAYQTFVIDGQYAVRAGCDDDRCIINIS